MSESLKNVQTNFEEDIQDDSTIKLLTFDRSTCFEINAFKQLDLRREEVCFYNEYLSILKEFGKCK